uniref:Uncharacterized protein n=2 Tax=Moniliophthora roreri TaxID=221103 RepID=A0A0W0FDJ4_MONRR
MIKFLECSRDQVLLWISITIPLVSSFKIFTQPSVAVGQNASFSWTWNQSEPDPQFIGIALKTNASNDGCPEIWSALGMSEVYKPDEIVKYTLRIEELPLEFDNTKRAIEYFVVRQTGPYRLCAYSYNESRQANSSLVASSDEFRAIAVDNRSKSIRMSVIAISTLGSFTSLLTVIILFWRHRRRKRAHHSLAISDTSHNTARVDSESNYDTQPDASRSVEPVNHHDPVATGIAPKAESACNTIPSLPINQQGEGRQPRPHGERGWQPPSLARAGYF